MPSTATAGRTSFLPFAYSSATTGLATNDGIPLFQAFSPIPVQGPTYSDCIKDGMKIDPAAGSGNFLTETYLSLRRLENQIIRDLTGGQMVFGEVIDPIKVSITQFHGIEINDFAVTVAKTALWIAESQMMKETESIIVQQLEFLPLTTNANIVEENALRIDWKDVVPAEKLNYLMGIILSLNKASKQSSPAGVDYQAA